MSIKLRRYKMLSDFERVNNFLRENFVRYGKNGNIQQPRWEYAHAHPYFNYQLTHRFGIWEDEGEIVAVACYEMNLGECFMMTKLNYEYLKLQLIEYAQQELFKINGAKSLDIWAYDYENQVIEALIKRGYQKAWTERINIYKYEKGFIERELPKGFTIISLEDENDIQKIHEVIWRGFDHGDTPDNDLDCRLQMQSAPNFRKDLTMIIKAPNGDYACFCGMWLDGVNDYAYLEPLATDPRYRGLGLATIALTESMKRTQKFGATYCFGGGSDFYLKIGFETVGGLEKWSKQWS